STISATTPVIDIGTTYAWTGAGLLADIQLWVANAAGNFGRVIIGDEVNFGNAVRFGSRGSETSPPVLSVTFQSSITPTPSPSPTPTPPIITPTPTISPT